MIIPMNECPNRIEYCNTLRVPDSTACELFKTALTTKSTSSSKKKSPVIPRTIHQSWKTKDVPERFNTWCVSASLISFLFFCPAFISHSHLPFFFLFPFFFFNRAQSWRDQNPRWNYKLWTDDDNRALVKKYYSWMLDTYDAFHHPIMRADSVRYECTYLQYENHRFKPFTSMHTFSILKHTQHGHAFSYSSHVYIDIYTCTNTGECTQI